MSVSLREKALGYAPKLVVGERVLASREHQVVEADRWEW